MVDKKIREWMGESPDTIQTVGKILIQEADGGQKKGLNKILFAGVVFTPDKIAFSKTKSLGKTFTEREMWECEITIKPIKKYKPRKDLDVSSPAYHGEIGDALISDWAERYNWDEK